MSDNPSPAAPPRVRLPTFSDVDLDRLIQHAKGDLESFAWMDGPDEAPCFAAREATLIIDLATEVKRLQEHLAHCATEFERLFPEEPRSPSLQEAVDDTIAKFKDMVASGNIR